MAPTVHPPACMCAPPRRRSALPTNRRVGALTDRPPGALQDRADQEAAQRARADARYSEAAQQLEAERRRLGELERWAQQLEAEKAAAEQQLHELSRQLEAQGAYVENLQVGPLVLPRRPCMPAWPPWPQHSCTSGTAGMSCCTLATRSTACARGLMPQCLHLLRLFARVQARAGQEEMLRSQAEARFQDALQQLEAERARADSLQVSPLVLSPFPSRPSTSPPPATRCGSLSISFRLSCSHRVRACIPWPAATASSQHSRMRCQPPNARCISRPGLWARLEPMVHPSTLQ